MSGLPVRSKTEKGRREGKNGTKMHDPPSEVMQPRGWPENFPGNRVVELPKGPVPEVVFIGQIEEAGVEPPEEAFQTVEGIDLMPIAIVVNQGKRRGQ